MCQRVTELHQGGCRANRDKVDGSSILFIINVFSRNVDFLNVSHEIGHMILKVKKYSCLPSETSAVSNQKQRKCSRDRKIEFMVLYWQTAVK